MHIAWGAAPSFSSARHADPTHRELLLPGRRQPARLRLSYNPRQAGRGGPQQYFGLNDREFEKDRVHIGTLRLEHALTDDIRLRNTLRYAFYGREAAVSTLAVQGVVTPTTPLNAISVSRAGAARDQEDTALINVTDAIVNFSPFGLKHTLVTCWSLAARPR